MGMDEGRSHNPTNNHAWFPSKGDRIELIDPRLGVRLRGTVYYSDDLQVLVKWDNGRSQSLRPGVDRFRLID
jgi:hypothetical protein